jgi:hypothetical protein
MKSTHVCAVRFFRPRKVALGLAGWFLAGNLSTSAAPIKTSAHKTHPVSAQVSEFEAFLKGGPGHWATTQPMKVPDGVHVRNKDGQLKDNLVVDYVMWMRDRHPIHFDHEHPKLGKQLAEAQAERGTQFLVFTTKHDKAAQAESIHAMTTTTAAGTATVKATPSTVAAVQAQVLDPPSTAPVFPAPRAAIVSASGAQLFPATRAAIVNSPQLEAEVLAPPMTPAISALPPPGGFNPPISQEISSSSVVTSNVQLAPEFLGPAPVPEPSPLLVTFLLFSAAAGWKGWRSRGLRGDRRVVGRANG